MNSRIFVVDDDPIISDLIKKFMSPDGYEVVGSSTNARDAINKIKILKPNLIFMDIVLEGDMDGIDAANFIYDKFGIPIVFLTSVASEKMAKRVQKSSAFGFIEKPFSKYSLITIAQISIEKKLNEELITKQKESYINILENLNEGIIAINGNSLVTYINRVGVDITLWSKKDIMRKRIEDMLILKDIKNGKYLRIEDIIKKFNKEGIFKEEIYLVRHNTTEIPVLLYLTKTQMMLNDTSGYVLFFSDISAELNAKKAKEDMINKLKVVINQLEETNRKFNEAQEEIIAIEKSNTVLATIVAANHELNQPLMILQGNLDLLKYKIPKDILVENNKYFKKMDEALKRIVKIMDKFQSIKDVEFVKYSDNTMMVNINKEDKNES
jgi:PAS domain S-box-containing protein